MENITIVSVESSNGSIAEHVIIDRGNGAYASMPKSVYDELQAQQAANNTALEG